MNPNAIKLVSANIERNRHLPRVFAFLQQEQADVVCLQEVFESDLQNFAQTLGMESAFGHMINAGYPQLARQPFLPFGIGILSKIPFQDVRRDYYVGDKQEAEQYIFDDNPYTYPRLLLSAVFQKQHMRAVLGTTHFTWSPNGQANDTQRQHAQSLFEVLQTIPELVFCGDLNAPRGREIFEQLGKTYTDNIPDRYTTSIDAQLHRAGDLQLMVDALFSTPEYAVSNVRLEAGVSDHMAIVAELTKTQP